MTLWTQHARPPCPSPSPKVCPSSCPLHGRCHPATSCSDALFSFCLQAFPESGNFPMSQLFTSDGPKYWSFNFRFFSITGWGIDLDYSDIEWFALEMNRNHSVVFEIASKYCISDSFVDYDGYSISFKGFLPTVVDIIVT